MSLTTNEPKVKRSERISDILSSGENPMVNDENENTVDFDGPDDPENPLNWSPAYKWGIVSLISIMSLVV